MNILETIQQGSDFWHTVRAQHFCASEASAMLGVSKYTTRSDLLKQKATGITPEVDAGTQYRFNSGHAAEAAARPIAEGIVGSELYPIVATIEIDGLKLLASFDGVTMDESIVWETKLWNEQLVRDVEAGTLHDHYTSQLEQQLIVSGSEKVLFTVSDGTPEKTRHLWYTSDPVRRSQLIDGWKQFEKDLAAYVPVVAEVKPVGHSPETLPALHIEVTGQVTASNLAEYKAHSLEVFGNINRVLTTDDHFADAEKTIKWCADIEGRLSAAKQHAQSQMGTIDELYRTIDDISAEARRVRLDLDKLVKVRKDDIRYDIVAKAKEAYAMHLAVVSSECDDLIINASMPDFAGAIKGKRNIESLRDAADTELARAKIAVDAAGRDIRTKQAWYKANVNGHEFLFSDLKTIIQKPEDDFKLLVASRISAHKAKEDARVEAERARIANDERIKAESAARVKADAEIAKARAEERIKAAAAEKAKVDAEVEARLQAHALNVAAEAEAQATKAITKAKEELPESAVTPVQPACVAIKTVVSSGVRGELNAALDRLDEVQLNRILSFVRSRYGAEIQEA